MRKKEAEIGRVETESLSDPVAIREKVFTELNAWRMNKSLQPFKKSNQLQRMIQEEVERIQAGYEPSDTTPAERAKEAGYSGELIGEALGLRTIQPEEITDRWGRTRVDIVLANAGDLGIGVGGSSRGLILGIAVGARLGDDGKPLLTPQLPKVDEMAICMPERLNLIATES